MTNFWQDIRHALRVLSKSRGFAAIAILTLALGIGANAALFSIVNGVLLNPLPFPNPDELYAVYSKTTSFEQSSISYPNFLDWQKQNHSFAALGAFRADDFNMTGAGEPERLHGHMISANFFPSLGLTPIVGRDFRPEEDRAGAGPLAILGDGLWKRKFASSRWRKLARIWIRWRRISPTRIPKWTKARGLRSSRSRQTRWAMCRESSSCCWALWDLFC
jgi:hypothetical protein